MQDAAEAVARFRRAAEQGDVSGQVGLGRAYSAGRGVPQDYIEAHMWFNLAGAKGDRNALENRDRLARQMTRTQIGEAQRRARQWVAKYAAVSSPAARRTSGRGEPGARSNPTVERIVARIGADLDARAVGSLDVPAESEDIEDL